MPGELVFYVNGSRVAVADPPLDWTLAQYLRERLRVCSVKTACEHGMCGACTVMVGRWCDRRDGPTYAAVNACLMPLWSAHGLSVTTSEGLGSAVKLASSTGAGGGLHAVQQRLAEGHASQCGFCTPGFVMSLAALLRNDPQPSKDAIDRALVGNLCRCTGYRPILEAAYSFSKEGCGLPDCCQKNKEGKGKADCEEKSQLVDWSKFRPYDASQDPIFPPQLQKEHKELSSCNLTFKGDCITVHRPSNLKALLELLRENPKATVVTSGLWLALRGRDRSSCSSEPAHWVSVAAVPELSCSRLADDGLHVGGAVTLTELQHALKEAVGGLKEHEARYMKALHDNLDNLFSQQLRNQGGWAGNICDLWRATSDIAGVLMCCGAKLTVITASGEQKTVPMDEHFYTLDLARGKTVIKEAEVISELVIPKSTEAEHVCSAKQGSRHGERERGLVCVDARFTLKPADGSFSRADVVCQGLVSQPVHLHHTQQALAEKKLDQKLLDAVQHAVEKDAEELFAKYGAPGNADYRTALAGALMLHLFAKLQSHCKTSAPVELPPVRREHIAYQSVQLYEEVPDGHLGTDPLYRPLPHVSAAKQATGEAQYTCDMSAHGMLHLALVLSTKAHAKLVNVDPSEALKLKGVVSYIDVKDIPAGGLNKPDTFSLGLEDDTEIFADGKVSASAA